jgi:hypothetical protein
LSGGARLDVRAVSHLGVITFVSSRSMQHPLTQQLEPASAVHHPFDQLQPVDLAFQLAIAPRQAQG